MTKKVKKLPKVNQKLVVSETKKTKVKVKKLTAEEKQEQFWNEVDQLAQAEIYQLLTKNLPFQNSKLITEFWQYEDRQQKLSGLYLHKDVDYRTLLLELENQWYEWVEEEGEELPTAEIMAEEVALCYCRLVMKALIRDLSDYAGYENHFFENLTADEY